MKAVFSRVIPGATPAVLFGLLGTLDRYPAWMRLVHRATPLEPDDGRAAWWVELRARVGPFTRSKELRMVRTEFEPGRVARFERVQADERDHAEWILTAVVDPPGERTGSTATIGGAVMTMHLEYTGQLWSRPVLGRILEDEIRRSTKALASLVAATSSAPLPAGSGLSAPAGSPTRVPGWGPGEAGAATTR